MLGADYFIPNPDNELVAHPKWPTSQTQWNAEILTMPFKVALEGNVGSGKTTLAKLLAELPEVQMVPEPLDEWRMVGHDEWGQPINLLEAFYANPAAFSSVMQANAVESFAKLGEQPALKPIVLQERSIHSCMLFTELLQDLRLLSENQAKNIADLADWYIAKNLGLIPDLVVYLQSAPADCFARVTRRSRVEERDKITLSYLAQLHSKHQQWLLADWPHKVLVVDASEHPSVLAMTVAKHLYRGLQDLRLRLYAARLMRSDIVRELHPDEADYLRSEAYGMPADTARVQFRSYYRDWY